MNGKWIITPTFQLGYKCSDDEVKIPTAMDIFNAEFRINNHFCNKPSDDIHGVEFSKFPLELNILVRTENLDNNIKIILEFVGKVNNKVINITGNFQTKTDHLIVNDTWYPLLKDNINEIETLIKEAEISKHGRISFQQYINLKKLNHYNIIDRVADFSFDKSESFSNKKIDIKGFKGTLFPYQNQGFRWLKMIVKEKVGGILADEMGLGKTAQLIAVLTSENNNAKNPSLVVAPLSLLENWKREVHKFAPDIRVKVHQGLNRTGFYKTLESYDLIITSYETITRDLSLFKMISWNILIADEAQSIKNPLAKRTLAIKELTRSSAFAVTGTPVENSLTDIWSITDFVLPNYLGDLENFKKKFDDSTNSAELLEPLLSPIMLRRRVKDVAGDLPERIIIPQVLKFSDAEAMLYEDIRSSIQEKYGQNASLVAVTKLRMYCTHPNLLGNNYILKPDSFTKYQRLIEIVEEIISFQEKVIIFTSFVGMADLLLVNLRKRFNVFSEVIDGRVHVNERQNIIDQFSQVKGSAILILNPKAAGTGLNITAANHVIHYNLEWNPALEDQASARAYRRGQTRPVTIHRLFFADTVDEVINDRIERKRQISETAIIGTDGKQAESIDILNAILRSPFERKGENIDE